MCFKIRSLSYIQARRKVCRANQIGLSLTIRHRNARGMTILISTRATNDGSDRISISQSIACRLDDLCRNSFSPAVACNSLSKGPREAIS
jgi:hypothetical protein